MTDEIVQNYRRFMAQPLIRAFLRNEGKVFVAIEGQPVAHVAALVEAGHCRFAEKFVQEAAARAERLRTLFPHVTVHYFGRLQQNKARKAVRLFEAIESLDRPELAARVRRLLEEEPASRVRKLFVQVNVGREPQKGGVLPEHARRFIGACLDMGLPVTGLMTIPPRGEPAAACYRTLRQLADAQGLQECVMGMSGDFAAGIHAGATAIRVGRAMFGSPARVDGHVGTDWSGAICEPVGAAR